MHEEASISASTPASAPEQNTRHGIRFSVVNTVTVALSVLFAIGLFITASAISSTSEELQIITDEYIDCENSAIAMKTASDYLSTQARMFGLTSDPAYLRRYLIELYDTKGREHSVQQFNARSQSESAKNYLASAMQQSEKLVEREKYAMKLIVVAEGIPPERGASELDEITLTAEDAALAPSDMLAKARQLLFDDDYQQSHDFIDRMVEECKMALEKATYENQKIVEGQLDSYQFNESVLALLMLAAIVCVVISHVVLIRNPLASYIANINENKPLKTAGAAELQHLAQAYNHMYEENQKHNANLLHEAEHDPLTGLLNRNAYNKLYNEHLDNQALILIDMDYFKDINDDYGHDIGDDVLVAVAHTLREVFRATDYPCRIGGDEFAVIMAGVDSSLRPVVEKRLKSIREALAKLDPSLPRITLCMGVAFSSDADEHTSIFKAADLALYSVKEAGRNGYAFYCDLEKQ